MASRTRSRTTVGTNWGSLILHRVSATGIEIGRGSYGRVFEVNYEGTLCAAKEVHALLLNHAQGDDLQKIKDDFLSECRIWSTLRHPCIVQFLGVYYSVTTMGQYRLPVMVTEKMQLSLRGLVEKYDDIPLNVKLSILDEACLGLRYLHSRNPPIVHRDLTPNNILLGYRLEAKITDLGVAKVVKSDNQKTMTKLPGTPDFMPPEALSIRPVYGPSLDVFSYGGVILNVTTQLWPQPTDPIEFNPDTGRREVVSEVTRRQQYLDKMTRDAAHLKPLVVSCLDDDAKNRPPVAQVSMTIKRVKNVCSQSSHDRMSPIIWWAEQQSQVTSSLTTALEEMTVNNEQLRKEVVALKTKKNMIMKQNTQLWTNNDVMKDEYKQLTTLLNNMADYNENQMQRIKSQSSEIATIKNKNKQLKIDNDKIKAKNVQLKIEIDDLKARPLSITLPKLTDKVGGIFDSMSDDDDDLFTLSMTVKSVPKTSPPKKKLSESNKKALSKHSSDSFLSASPIVSKAQTSTNHTPSTVTATTKIGRIFDSMSDDDDLFTSSMTAKSVPKTAPPKKKLTESDKKPLSASLCTSSLFDYDVSDDLFAPAKALTSTSRTSSTITASNPESITHPYLDGDLFHSTKTSTSDTPATIAASKPKRMPKPLFDDDDDELD